MAKENQIWKVMFYGTVLSLLLSTMNSCSKAEDKPKEDILTIDLNEPKYSSLLNHNSYLVITEKNLIIGNWHGDYTCAYNSCTYCLNGLIGNPKPTAATWVCQTCTSEFGWSGEIIKGPAATGLKVYSIVKTGNILTIKLSK